MDCAWVEERLSDHREGALDPVVRAEIETHLASCPACSTLLAALDEVLGVLHRPVEAEPPEGFETRVAGALRRERARAALRLPRHVQLLAASLALAIGGLTTLALGPGADRLRAAGGSLGRIEGMRLELLDRRDRALEDLRLLGVVVSTAFEGRLDRVGDRVQDYRRLLERRRAAAEAKKKTNRETQKVVNTCDVGAASSPLTETAALVAPEEQR